MDQYRLSHSQIAVVEQGVVSGKEHLGHRCRLHEIQVVGDSHGHSRVGDHPGGIPATAQQAEDAVPHRQVGDVGPGLQHHA